MVFIFALHLIIIPSGELDGEVFDLLMSLGDFSEFKQLMLSYKQAKHSNGTDIASLGVFGVRVSEATGAPMSP
jgi:hypothetical protein